MAAEVLGVAGRATVGSGGSERGDAHAPADGHGDPRQEQAGQLAARRPAGRVDHEEHRGRQRQRHQVPADRVPPVRPAHADREAGGSPTRWRRTWRSPRPRSPRSGRARSRSASRMTSDTRVLTAPIAAKRTSWRPKSSASGGPRGRAEARACRRPRANVRTMRTTPAEVVDRGARDVDAAVGVVDPVDRHLVDAQAVVLGERGAARCRRTSRRPRPSGSSRRATSVRTALKPHCASRHPGREHGAQDAGCSVREISSRFGARGDRERRARAGSRSRRRSGPETSGATSGRQRVEVGREVDVHVRDDGGVARGPRRPQREAAALAVEVDGAHPGQVPGEAAGATPRCRRSTRCRRS